MAIQLRRGNYVDYDPTKMKDGEVAVVKAGDPATNDGKSAYIEISGDSKRIILEDDPTSNNTVNFTSGDAADPSDWTNVAIVASGETHASLFNKITTMIKNTRWIKKFLGNTSISSIGNGTVTGALSKLNTDRNLVVADNFINIPDNTTSFTAFDTVINSLSSFQGNTFEVHIGAGVVLDGVTINGGRKYCQIIRHSSTRYAAITMFGWLQNDRYLLVKSEDVWSCTRLPTRAEVDQLSTDRNIVLNDNTVITLAENTTSFTAFDTLISSLSALQGKTFEVQVNAGVVLDGIAIRSGRKFAQMLRHSSTNYAVIHMFGWANEDDQYRITKYNGTWSCVKMPSRSEITKLNTDLTRKVSSLTKSSSNISDVEFAQAEVCANIGMAKFKFTVATAIAEGTTTLFTGNAYPPRWAYRGALYNITGNVGANSLRIAVNSDGSVSDFYTPGGIPAGQYEGYIMYLL